MLAHVKSNDGPEMPSLLYEIEPIQLPASDNGPDLQTSRLELLGESPHSGKALLASASTSEEEHLARNEAEEFLLAELGDNERHQAGPLIKAARQLGFSEATLRRARQSLGVETEKTGFGDTGAWQWRLPAKASPETSKPAFLHKAVTPQRLTPLVKASDVTPSEEPCQRHPDEPRSWCLECLASGAVPL